MIHYHGIDGIRDSVVVDMRSCHFIVSFAYPGKIGVAAKLGQSFIIDNGAYSFWKSGKETNWLEYYNFVLQWFRHPGFDFAIIPDVIDGTESENDALLREWPFGEIIGVPVWHLHETLIRLDNLCREYPRIALGSSGAYAVVGNKAWKERMKEVMQIVCNKQGIPRCKIHGLRMMNPRVFTKYPFSSVDSNNVSRNHTIDKTWKGTYKPLENSTKAYLLARRVEYYNSAEKWIETNSN